MNVLGYRWRTLCWFGVITALAARTTMSVAQVDVPNVFSDGTPALATEINENFSAVESSIDSNASRIMALESASIPQRTSFTLRLDRSNSGTAVDYTVPADRILVIESINVSAGMSTDYEVDRADLRIRPPGVSAVNDTTIMYVPIPITASGKVGTAGFPTSGLTNFRTGVGSLTTRLYAGPSHDLLFSIPSITSFGNEAFGTISIFGYLLPSDSKSLAP